MTNVACSSHIQTVTTFEYQTGAFHVGMLLCGIYFGLCIYMYRSGQGLWRKLRRHWAAANSYPICPGFFIILCLPRVLDASFIRGSDITVTIPCNDMQCRSSVEHSGRAGPRAPPPPFRPRSIGGYWVERAGSVLQVLPHLSFPGMTLLRFHIVL